MREQPPPALDPHLSEGEGVVSVTSPRPQTGVTGSNGHDAKATLLNEPASHVTRLAGHRPSRRRRPDAAELRATLKVGLVTHYMPPHQGGIERVAETLFCGYTEAGLDVRWIASRVPASAPARDGGRVRVRCWNVLERLLGVPVPFWGVEGWSELARLVKWADALHVHDCLYPSSALAVVLARRAGKPVLLSQHMGFVHYRISPLNWLERTLYATLGRAVLRGASRVVFVTPGAARYARPLLGRAARRALHIPNGIDTSRFRPPTPAESRAAREHLRLPLDRAVVLFAGRLVDTKGIDLVLGVSRRLPDVHFLVVGDGPNRHLLRERGVNVSWLPAVDPDGMAECYRACDCLLLPSHGEGFPLVVQEVLASGRPAVISEDEAYAPHLIGAGLCAGTERTESTIVAQVSLLLGGAGSDMGARGSAYAAAHWNYRTMLDRYIGLLADMILAATPVPRH